MVKVPGLEVRNLTIPAVRRGSRVAVISPASYPQPDKLAKGVETLGRFSFVPYVGRQALSKANHYFAGSAQARLDDLPPARSFVAVEVTVPITCWRASTWGWYGSIPSHSLPIQT